MFQRIKKNKELYQQQKLKKDSNYSNEVEGENIFTEIRHDRIGKKTRIIERTWFCITKYVLTYFFYFKSQIFLCVYSGISLKLPCVMQSMASYNGFQQSWHSYHCLCAWPTLGHSWLLVMTSTETILKYTVYTEFHCSF